MGSILSSLSKTVIAGFVLLGNYSGDFWQRKFFRTSMVGLCI